jgi:F-type H+-transporting ATPase subunit delta
MNDFTRGFVAAASEDAGSDGKLDELAGGLEGFQAALAESDDLRFALTDGSLALGRRRGVVRDLLSQRALEAFVVVSYVLGAERPTDLPIVISQVREAARDEADRVASGEAIAAEPAGGRWAVWDRVRGYADFVFHRLVTRDDVARVEDELFRFTRVVEATPELMAVLPDTTLGVDVRVQLVEELLRGKATPATIRLISYQLRAGRVRDIVRSFDHLVELAALERGRRLAEVRAPAALSDAEQSRLADALALMVGRQVEVRVVIDPAMIGGMLVNIGDTLIDGTVRRRLLQLRESLDTSTWTAA